MVESFFCCVHPEDKLENLDQSFAILKRSLDEAPFHLRAEDGSTVPIKLLNQRVFFRWSREEAARFIIPAGRSVVYINSTNRERVGEWVGGWFELGPSHAGTLNI